MSGRVSRVRPVGDGAVLLDCGDLAGAMRVFSVLGAAREAGRIEFGELVPAAETVLVRGGLARRPAALAACLAELFGEPGADIGEGAPDSAGRAAHPATIIPVVYDGEDLAEVAALTGMSAERVARRHSAADYTVAFTGFAPGFAYLVGGDPALVVPRRGTPRRRIAAGSVGLAGEFSGVYPRASPGGWQLIGRTDLKMWDLERESPALLVPGAAVRFEPEREHVRASGAKTPALSAASAAHAGPDEPLDEPGGRPSLEVVETGLQVLVQDAGRPGLARIGVSASGAADRGAVALANRLVGNSEPAAVLELLPGDFVAEVLDIAVLALTGAPRTGSVHGRFGVRAVPRGRAFRVDAGETLRLSGPERGLRTVLAVRGGVTAPIVLGSASRDTLAELGPEPLAPGDVIRAGGARVRAVGRPECGAAALPAVGDEAMIGVLPGPRDDWFEETGMVRLWGESWEVTPSSDRVGVRLKGAPLVRAAPYRESELPSEALAAGAIQVPPDGQPVLFLADHPITGGYPVIGVVCERHLDLAAQLPPGARVRFRPAPVTAETRREP